MLGGGGFFTLNCIVIEFVILIWFLLMFVHPNYLKLSFK